MIDDVLGLLVLAVVSSLTHGKLDFLQLSLTALAATAFTVIAAKWGHHTMGRIVPHVERNLKISESRFVLAMGLLFALALLAVYTGVAAIVGAFLAGLALGESTGNRERDLLRACPSCSSVLPGRHRAARRSFSLHSPQDRDASSLDSRGCDGVQVYRLQSGGARNGQGGRIAHRSGYDSTRRSGDGIAQIGLGFGILSQSSYGVVVFMSVATTILAPPLIKVAYRKLLEEGQGEIGEEVLRMG